jgi:hypothetical protein
MLQEMCPLESEPRLVVTSPTNKRCATGYMYVLLLMYRYSVYVLYRYRCMTEAATLVETLDGRCKGTASYFKKKRKEGWGT